MTTIATQLEQLRQQSGENLVLPIPPLCQQILALARAEGIACPTLFVLRQPLEPDSVGSYRRSSGELWCLYDPTAASGLRELVQHLLVLLVAVRERLPDPRTIDEDWEQVRRSREGAYELALQWHLTEWYAPQDYLGQVDRDQYHLRCHLAAAALAGDPDPQIARKTFLVLLRLAQERGWDEASFLALLEGVEDHQHWEEVSAVLGWPRVSLRQHWLLTGQHAQRSWGTLARPFTPRAAVLLRTALEQAMRLPPFAEAATRQPFWFLLLQRFPELAHAIHLIHTWLAKEAPQTPIRLQCWGYGEHTEAPLRLYRLRIVTEQGPFRVREAWVLLEGPAVVHTEAAWQHYLASWLTFANWETGTLAEGLATLWQVQRRQQE